MGTIVKFIVYSAGYNCKEFVKSCILSITNQESVQSDIEHILVDDCSTDGTFGVIKRYHVGIRTDKRRGWLYNAAHYLKPSDDDIVIIVDMDDRLASSGVISYIEELYRHTNCWMTYGSFIWQNSGIIEGKAYPEGIDYRNYEWRAVHLQTFKGFLWNNIDKTDFILPNGNWAMSAYDRAVMLPILEMTPYDKQRFVDKVLYIYNDSNPLNIYKVDKQEQIDNANYFHSLSKYKMRN